MKLCPAEVDASRELAKRGGLQDHSIGGPYPWIVVGIENPTYIHREVWETGAGQDEVETVRRLEGTFFYVQNPDGTIGSLLYDRAETAAELASQIKDGLLNQLLYTRYTWAGIYGD